MYLYPQQYTYCTIKQQQQIQKNKTEILQWEYPDPQATNIPNYLPLVPVHLFVQVKGNPSTCASGVTPSHIVEGISGTTPSYAPE